MTLAALAAGRPVDISTIRRLDEIGRAEPVLEIAHELLPADVVGAGESPAAERVIRHEAEAELEAGDG